MQTAMLLRSGTCTGSRANLLRACGACPPRPSVAAVSHHILLYVQRADAEACMAYVLHAALCRMSSQDQHTFHLASDDVRNVWAICR